MQHLEKKYQKLLEQKRSVEKIKKYLQYINGEIETVDHELAFIDRALEKKNIAYERLRKKTPASLLARIKGIRHKRINNKLSDYHELVLQRKSQERSKHLLEFEENILLEKLKIYKGLPVKLKDIEQKLDEQKLIKKGRNGKRLVELRNQVRQLKINQKEIAEALKAGENLILVTDNIKELLYSLSYKSSLFSFQFMDIKFEQLGSVRELFPQLKMEVLKFEQEYREAFPQSPDFRLFKRDKEYKLMAKALFCPKIYQKEIKGYRGVGWGFWQVHSKVDTKTHQIRKRLKTLDRQLERATAEKERLEKIVFKKIKWSQMVLGF